MSWISMMTSKIGKATDAKKYRPPLRSYVTKALDLLADTDQPKEVGAHYRYNQPKRAPKPKPVSPLMVVTRKPVVWKQINNTRRNNE